MNFYKFQNEQKHNPFYRPWIQNNCAASGNSSMGLKGLLVGGFVGALEGFLSYPVELAKTKLQLYDKVATKGKSRGLLNEFKQTINERGFFGLYRGVSVILVFSIPKIGIRFSSFEILKSYTVDESGNLSPMMRIFCGLGAGIFEAIFAVTPMETVKVKFIDDQGKKNPEYKGLVHGIRKIIEQNGIKGVYQGLMPTIVRQGSNQAIRFSVMETLKNNYRKGDPDVVVPNLVMGVFGFLAATASVIGNTPIDVVKTRMQGLDAKNYKNAFDCAKKLLENEGVTAFYKGGQARLLRVCIDVVFTFIFYERIIEKINKMWP